MMYRVLIATADVLMREALCVMLSEEQRFQVVGTAETGEKAIQACKGKSIHIVFMDMQLASMNGIEASRFIRQSSPDSTIYILAPHPINSLLKHFPRENVKDIVEKPLNRQELKKLLENYNTEHEDSGQEQLKQLLSIVRERQFGTLYTNIGRITDEIYETMGNDPERVYKLLLLIGQSLINTMDFYDMENKSIDYLFPLNQGLIMERKTTELWLFRIMDYLFQRSSINRYSLLENIFIYIEHNIKEDITLNKIIDNCAISQGYLSRIFREQFCVSVMEYLHMRKIHLAKAYFYFTDDNIAEVAFRLGYNESSYFSKVFRKYENMTVKQYRLTVRGKDKKVMELD